MELFMKKSIRVISIVLSLCIAFSVWCVYAEDFSGEMIANGGAERMGSDGFAASWWRTGDGISIINEGAHTGNNAMKIIAKSGESICQKINGLVGGSSCTLTIWANVIDGATSFYTKFEIRDTANAYLSDSPIVGYVTHTVEAKRRWQKITYTFNMPAAADNGYFYIKFLDNTNMYLDDISMTGPVNAAQTCTFVDVPEGNPNLAVNGEYEDFNETTGAANWEAYLGWGGGAVTVVKDDARGNNVLRVQSDGSTNPWGRQLVPVEPMTTYQITSMLKTVEMSGSIKYKFEFFANIERDTTKGYSEAQSQYFNATFGTWQKVGTTVQAPAFAKYVAVYMRLYGGGTAYFDDVTVHKVSDPPHMYYSASAFNYVDNEIGIAAARPNTLSYETPAGSRVLFEILDGTTILESYETKTVNDTRYEFKLSSLPKKDTYYTLKTTYKNADGTVIDSNESKISKVTRPTMLRKDGTFVTKDGKEITPVVGYHLGTLDNLDHCVDMGINVVQWNPGGAVEPLLQALDAAYAKGMYIAVLLYDNGKPAGHESNIAKTTNLIKNCKDHPAVFAWMVQDEAYWANPNCYPDLFASYELIHSLDPDHPVYLLETSGFFAIEVAGVCDYYISDPYVNTNHIRKVSEYVKEDTDVASKLGRPHLAVLQAFSQGGFDPDSNEMRHQCYQTFFANGASVGYYPINAELGNPNLWESKRYEGIKAFNKDELEDAVKAFVTGEYPTFAEAANNNLSVWYKMYVKNSELYMILLNMSDTEEMSVDIPLVSGGTRIGAFTATPVDKSGAETISGNGRFTATLAPSHVAKYKITTTEPVDFSLLSQNLFTDLAGYEWAEKAIEFLGGIDIVTGTADRVYSPSLNITRGDFAKYLVRTLGLLGDKTENFADVNPDAPYAKEIMIGKSLGILNGVGDNSFNPEASISRQDLMTICSRALQYVEKQGDCKEDMTIAFSDSALISGYAKDAVSAMINDGIIAGNADGTINPLGYTTRAEAAVIMYRIFNHEIFKLNPAGFMG